MARTFVTLVTFVLMTAALAAEDKGAKAQYMGGTLALDEKSAGQFDLSGDTSAIFRCRRGEATVPYAGIESIEYGQKAGRRVGAAVVVSPLFLLSKGRKHFVTVSFKDGSGARQGAVFQVDKGSVYRLVTTLSTKSGKAIEYESEDAKKHLAKEAK